MKNDKTGKNDFIYNLLKGLNIPRNRIFYLHVRLRNIQSITGQDYLTLTKSLLDSLQELFQPKTILIPSFTYTFTKTGAFNRLTSPSEVGRFSEDVRQHFAKYRTPDPVFSVLDTTGYFSRQGHIDYKTAFGKGSLFEYLHKSDCVIMNIDLEEFMSTQLHYVEKVCNVSYRYDKVFKGIIYHDKTYNEQIEYTYYVRDLELNPEWNRARIEQFLTGAGVINSSVKDGVRILWWSAREMMEALKPKLKEDDKFLIT